jgi:hypothetical protein
MASGNKQQATGSKKTQRSPSLELMTAKKYMTATSPESREGKGLRAGELLSHVACYRLPVVCAAHLAYLLTKLHRVRRQPRRLGVAPRPAKGTESARLRPISRSLGKVAQQPSIVRD